MKHIILIVLLSFLSNTFGQTPKLLLKTDEKGKVIDDSIDSLIKAVRQGNSINVGLSLDFDKDGNPDVEHLVNAKFLTILNGHVFNQIEPIYAQAPNGKVPQVEIGNNNMQWTGIIGSNGILMSRFIIPDIEEQTDENYKKQLELMSQVTEEIVETSWFEIK
jgi:hypothetical protein